jgi:hypothetical protein
MALSGLLNRVDANASSGGEKTQHVKAPVVKPKEQEKKNVEVKEEKEAKLAEVKVEKKVDAKEKKKAPRTTDQNHYFVNEFERPLKKAELWFGNHSTGKTFLAHKTCDEFLESGKIDDYLVVNCHEDLTIMSLFKTIKTDEDGKWRFLPNKFFKFLTDELESRVFVIFDEFNTLPMSVMKALQPIMDDSEGEFEFEDKTYKKNPNINWILTMNHDDIGISSLPKAIIDRLRPKYFPDLTLEELEKRSGVPKRVIITLGKIRQMFEHLGDLPDFHKSVRQLINLRGANSNEMKDYIISQLELAHIPWEEAVSISPEFSSFIKEFDEIKWKE